MIRDFIRAYRKYHIVDKWNLDNFGVSIGYSRLSYAVMCAKLNRRKRKTGYIGKKATTQEPKYTYTHIFDQDPIDTDKS